MKKYDFDKIVDRTGTDAIKYETLAENFGRTDLIPLWIADMEFETPYFIVDALRKRLEHPLFGYTVTPEPYWECIQQWILSHHGWKVEREWMSFIPGIVKGIGFVVNVFTKPGDKVIIQPPVYHPFRLTPQNNGREVVYNPLRQHDDGSYSMDFEQLEQLVDDRCKLLILSNPHNPAGILWDRQTLTRLADFCFDHGILVISDEIHCDMALWGLRHIPFASVSDKAAQCSISFGAPSKTFNIAGIVSSYSIVPNPQIRKVLYDWIQANELGDPTLFAPIATMAAFTEQGEEWRRQMLEYVEENIKFVEYFCMEDMPQIRPLRPQASFLIWLDCRQLGLSQPQLVDLFVNKARLALNDGAMFGREGEGFMRLNVAEPRSVLEKAMQQLKAAIDTLK
jgi:cystathionine beta-lyase